LPPSPLPQPALPKKNDIDLNIDTTNVLTKINVHVPFTEIMKIPSIRGKVKRFLNVQEESEDPPIQLQANHFEPTREKHEPFFNSLAMNGLWLCNCMLDSGASANVMTLKVMKQLGLEITRPYGNVCGIDSNTIKVCGLIKDLGVCLDNYPEVAIVMDVVVIDVSDA
jgi:hypothetical protein